MSKGYGGTRLKTAAAIFVCVAMLFVSCERASEFEFVEYVESVEYFEFVKHNEEITITGYRGNARTIVIPGRINDFPVTRIGDDAFYEKQLSGVTIPDSVITIGDRAFTGNRLTDLIIPDSVTLIGIWAFGENQLSSITIDDLLIALEDEADGENQPTTVTLHDINIDPFVFGPSLRILKSFTLPDLEPHSRVFGFANHLFRSILGTINENTISFYAPVWDDLAGREVWARELADFAFDLPDGYHYAFAFGVEQLGIFSGNNPRSFRLNGATSWHETTDCAM